jgi:hypothetical protein
LIRFASVAVIVHLILSERSPVESAITSVLYAVRLVAGITRSFTSGRVAEIPKHT